MTIFESVYLLFNIHIDANSVDPDQTAPKEQSDLEEQSDLDLHCLLKRLQTTKAYNFL